MHTSQVNQQSSVYINSSSYNRRSKTTTIRFSTFGELSNLTGELKIELGEKLLRIQDVVYAIGQLKGTISERTNQKTYYKLSYTRTTSESINIALTELNGTIQAHNSKLDKKLATELDKLGFTDVTEIEKNQIETITQALQGQAGWIAK